MKELLTYIVQSLVEKPDEVSVTEHEAGGETVFEVWSPPAIWARSSAVRAAWSRRSAC